MTSAALGAVALLSTMAAGIAPAPLAATTGGGIATASPAVPSPVEIADTAGERTASPWTWSLNEEGVARSWEDDEGTSARREDFADGMNRLYGVVTRGGVEAGLQIDIPFASPAHRAALTSPEMTPPPGATTGVLAYDEGSETEWAVVLEKKFLRWRTDRVTVEAGDAYRAVGRGLALSLVRNTELDIDTSLEGAVADATLGAFELSAWGGFSNPQTISTAFSNHTRRDSRDRIFGGRAAWAGPVTVFAHAGSFGFDAKVPGVLTVEGENVEARGAVLAGGGLTLPDFLSGLGDLHVEGLGLQVSAEDDAGERVEYDGWGAYAAANVYAGDVTVTLEGKSYRNLELLNVRAGEGASPYDYSTPPTLEKENIVDYNLAKAVNSVDVHGGKATVSVPVGGGFLGRVSYAHFEDLGHPAAESVGSADENEHIDHGMISIERRKESVFFQVTAGGREERRMKDPDVKEHLLHVDADLLLPLPWTRASIELKTLAYRQTETSGRSGFERTIDVTSSVGSIRPARWLSLAAIVDTTTDTRSTTGFGARQGNLSDYTFGAVEVTVEPTEQSAARVFVGATQGGLKCSGGTCRVVPAFEGVRVEWLARF